jgi:RNA recognition motif-containing protein
MIGELTRRVYVSNVPDFYTEKLIKDIFSLFGSVAQVRLIPALLPEQPGGY